MLHNACHLIPQETDGYILGCSQLLLELRPFYCRDLLSKEAAANLFRRFPSMILKCAMFISLRIVNSLGNFIYLFIKLVYFLGAPIITPFL